MKLSFKRFAATAALATALATVVTIPASATDKVDCGDRTDFVRITENFRTDHCFANSGSYDFRRDSFWASKISSGNNDITWVADGYYHDLPRWNAIVWPTVGTVHLQTIIIK
ncbi:beta/gamma crystallin domain-containing protein [Streptomyces sp. NPDC051987]|uniref:beta/gamma crystallin domain-containing protein n=1 Tax=Streptomyces sp. NPDC051987 TaxID=3155808 RepID=UPI003439AE70